MAPEDMKLTEHEQLIQTWIKGGDPTLPATYSRVFHLDDDVAWTLQLWTRSFLEFGLVGTLEYDGLHCTHLAVVLNSLYSLYWNQRQEKRITLLCSRVSIQRGYTARYMNLGNLYIMRGADRWH